MYNTKHNENDCRKDKEFMDGVTKMKREFSSDFVEIGEWKYEVEYFDECTQIKYMVMENGIWKIRERIDISACCDEILFKTIAKDFERKTVEEIRK